MSILFDNPPPAIGCGDPGDPIDFACLFNASSATPAYLRRAPGTASPIYKIAISVWAKTVSVGGSVGPFLTAGLSPAASQWVMSNNIGRGDGGTTNTASIAPSHRDPAGWGHYLIKANVTPGTALADRAAFTANGVTFTLASNLMDDGVALRLLDPQYWQAIGANLNSSGSLIDANQSVYVSEFIAITGDAVDAVSASDFGYFNSDGDWVPKAFYGKGLGAAVYGANGCHLDFGDALDLGKDVSGNGNHFTAVGLTDDNQFTDTPTNNFAVGNPLDAPTPAGRILSEGNTAWQPAHNPGEGHIAASMLIPAGKYYWEVLVETGAPFSPSTIVPAIGFAHRSVAVNEANGAANGLFHYHSNGNLVANPWGTDSGYPSWTVDDVVSVAIDRETGDCWFAKNGVWISGDPVAGTDPAFTIPADWLDGLRASVQDSSASGAIKAKVNFGQFAFDYPVPDGFRTLSTSGMPCPAILNPDDYVTVRKVGDTTPLPWNPLVHKTLMTVKDRDSTASWRACDTLLGDGKAWAPDVSGLEISEGSNGVTWTPTGPTFGAAAEYAGNRIATFWRASPKAGFDFVDVISDAGGAPTSFTHLAGGLIDRAWVVPLDGGPVRVFHRAALGSDKYLILSSDGAAQTSVGWFGSDAASATVKFPTNGARYRVYLWRAVAQFSAFPAHVGNGNPNGKFIPLDFLPRFAEIKNTAGTYHWNIRTTDQNPGNPVDIQLAWSSSATETPPGSGFQDFVSNGITIRNTEGTENLNGVLYANAIFAQTPGKFARAR
ncbi:hypothetical protein ABIE64_003481 [Thalassospira sp. MBR-102]|jgi:hypothetical protein|uniref:DUF7483 domain-containing protein n=1 Tax=Thalassospira sp. MBR-102 TaxID=3156466 RepID=UPI003396D67F